MGDNGNGSASGGDRHDPPEPSRDFEVGVPIAQFDWEWNLPEASTESLKQAKAAVRQELRGTTRWKRLQCDRITIISERDRGTVYGLHVAGPVDFDWTWEGAQAFRLQADTDEIDDRSLDFADFEDSPVEDAFRWSGEVLEVDEINGCLFVMMDSERQSPSTGVFHVRPFEFLRALDEAFHGQSFASLRDELSKRLPLTTGELRATRRSDLSVAPPLLPSLWDHDWSILWGPPGTGKTYTIGQQVAAAVKGGDERVLVVSTTNRATDEAALSIGRAMQSDDPERVARGELLRVGRGATPDLYAAHGLERLLGGGSVTQLQEIKNLKGDLGRLEDGEDRALLRMQIAALRGQSGDSSRMAICDARTKVIVATAFRALNFLSSPEVLAMLDNRRSPFTTIVIDEAGLIPRATVAALSLLASRRVVLAGDSKQLAPISRMLRVLSTRQHMWLATSGLGHLDELDVVPPSVHVLFEQHRMQAEIGRVVSRYQYGGRLRTAESVGVRTATLPSLFRGGPRAIWQVLDEESSDLATIRAERGPGNRSWTRAVTLDVLERLFSDAEVRAAKGLFLTPFSGQAKLVAAWLTKLGVQTWQASTVHSQQGAEAEVVILDTVNAGSHGWPYDEWKRLINVGMSRAREAFVLMASRSEMEEPYLRPLVDELAPRVLRVVSGDALAWVETKGLSRTASGGGGSAPPPSGSSLGAQFARNRLMKPVLSREQQRLSNLELDGKPRLVRGVAGSGKTLVLSRWLAKTAMRLSTDPKATIWAVYANRSLHRLIRESIEAAWRSSGVMGDFPWEQVRLLHVRDVLADLFSLAGSTLERFEFDYDRAAEELLGMRQDWSEQAGCRALFIDEAQDLGPSTLRLLLMLVEQTSLADKNSKSAHIFFDNAQNIYGRKTPKWSEFGLDMRGRSTIMRESFRATRPITEFAINLLQRLASPGDLTDHEELRSLGLLVAGQREGREWLEVKFSQVEGPPPIVRTFRERRDEFKSLEEDLTRLIVNEQVAAADICVLYNGPRALEAIVEHLEPLTGKLGLELSVQRSRDFERRSNTLLVTTSHSYKGYESDVVLIPCADQYTTSEGEVLAANLYVAMTRAKSILAIYSTDSNSAAITRLNRALRECRVAMSSRGRSLESGPDDGSYATALTGAESASVLIDPAHQAWYLELKRRFRLRVGALHDGDGEEIVTPVFWFVEQGKRFAFFSPGVRDTELDRRLRERGFEPCVVGEWPEELAREPKPRD